MHGMKQCDKQDWDMGDLSCSVPWCNNKPQHDWGVEILCCAHDELLNQQHYIDYLHEGIQNVLWGS